MRDTEGLSAYRWTIVFASALILAIAMGSIVNGMSAYIVLRSRTPMAGIGAILP